MRRFFAAGFLVVLSGLCVTAAYAASPGASSTAPRSIPDVYVKAGNSFVITVPNLTKVAIGNPLVVSANVISTTEVLVQGRSTLEINARNAFINQLTGQRAETAGQGAGEGTLERPKIATSEVFVWSGEKRYVYRVVVIDIDPDKLPFGISRIEVEPDRLIVYGLTPNAAQTTIAVKSFEAAGLKVESRIDELNLPAIVRAGQQIDTQTMVAAESRGIVLQGMTKAQMLEAKGPPPALPGIRIERTPGGKLQTIEEYFYPDLYVQVVDGYVERVLATRLIDQATIDEAIAKHKVLAGMTREEMMRAKGEPSVPPTIQLLPAFDTRITRPVRVEVYAYPDVEVRLEDGYVAKIVTHVSPETARQVENVTLQSTGVGGVIRETKIYRLRYAEPQEVVTMVRHFLSPSGTFVTQEVLRTIIIEDLQANIATIDQIMRVIDSPRNDKGISIMRTKYIDGTTWNITGNSPSMGKEIIVLGLGTLLDAQTKAKIVKDLKDLGNKITLEFLPGWDPGARAMWDFYTIDIANGMIIIGPPGILDVVTSFVSQNYMGLSNDDIQRTIEVGGIVQGMTREQVEIALKQAPTAPPRQVQAAGGVLWEYEYQNLVLRFKQQQLYQILNPPTPEKMMIAREAHMLLWGMTKDQLDDVLLEKGVYVPSIVLGPLWIRYRYPSGEALFSRNRLEEFLPALQANLIVPGELMPGAGGLGNIYTRISAEDRQRLIENRKAVPGMSMSDIAQIYPGIPPAFITPEIDDDGRATWTYKYPGQTVKVQNGMVIEVTSQGQDEIVTKIVPVVSRKASDILPIVLATMYSDKPVAAAGAAGATASTDTQTANIRVDLATNSLIIRDKLSKISDVLKFVQDLDKTVTSQVLIEAKFVEINRQAIKQLGVEWSLSGQAPSGNRPFAGFGGTAGAPATGGTQVDPTAITGAPGNPAATTSIPLTGDAGLLLGMIGGNGFSFGGLRYTNVDVLISALESSGDADVLSSPRIATINNQPARIQSIDRVYDVTTTTTVTGTSGTATTSTQITPRDVGITLDVNPTIGQDGIVTLDLSAVVSRVLRVRQLGSPANVILINEISERNSKSRVMVRSGTPLVIGGLSSRSATRTNQKIPGLGSLPFIGRLFRTDNNISTDVDLLIFLTARIVPPDGTLAPIDRVVNRVRPEISNPTPTTTLPDNPSTASNTSPASAR